jgi:hypothetical protein
VFSYPSVLAGAVGRGAAQPSPGSEGARA